jgi:very-long-chain (3R)-3-hydroxyacyl-CoA dehydratase
MSKHGMCRYSAFIPLYPLGVLAGEMPLIWSGLPYIKQRKLHSIDMPNSFNFAFSYHAFAQVSAKWQADAEST